MPVHGSGENRDLPPLLFLVIGERRDQIGGLARRQDPPSLHDEPVVVLPPVLREHHVGRNDGQMSSLEPVLVVKIVTSD